MILTILASAHADTADPTWKYYAENLRAGLFTGFLTMSSFLLTMTTFVIMNLKEKYYDTDAYKKRVVKRRSLGSKRSYYSPLRNLGTALIVTIALSFTASVAQFTIGLHDAQWSVLVCATLAGLAILALGFNLFQILQNMRVLFGAWEKERAGETGSPPAASTHS